MTKGIVLLSFGKPQYMYMAAHLALSIKYWNKDVPVSIVSDQTINYLPPAYRELFDKEIPLKDEDFHSNYSIDPGKAKIRLIDYLPYDRNVYLDVDGLAVQDVSPLLEIEGFYNTEVVGSGTVKDTIEYSWWATNRKIWDFFQLEDSDIYHSIQSSFATFEKGKKLDELKKRLEANFSFPIEDLQNGWGGTMPDELIFAGSCAQMKHNPDCGRPVVFFGHKLSKMKQSEIESQYFILSLYGNGNGTPLVRLRYREQYDRLMAKICRETKMPLLGKVLSLTKTKHANR